MRRLVEQGGRCESGPLVRQHLRRQPRVAEQELAPLVHQLGAGGEGQLGIGVVRQALPQLLRLVEEAAVVGGQGVQIPQLRRQLVPVVAVPSAVAVVGPERAALEALGAQHLVQLRAHVRSHPRVARELGVAEVAQARRHPGAGGPVRAARHHDDVPATVPGRLVRAVDPPPGLGQPVPRTRRRRIPALPVPHDPLEPALADQPGDRGAHRGRGDLHRAEQADQARDGGPSAAILQVVAIQVEDCGSCVHGVSLADPDFLPGEGGAIMGAKLRRADQQTGGVEVRTLRHPRDGRGSRWRR